MGSLLLIGSTVGAVLVASVAYLISVVNNGRSRVRALAKLGMPMPEYHHWFGHLLTSAKIFESLPPAAHSCYALNKMQKLSGAGAFYFDPWPLFAPLLIVCDASMAEEVVNHKHVGVRKSKSLMTWARPICHGPNMFVNSGDEWRRLHALYSPAFRESHVRARIPGIVDRVCVLRSILREKVAPTKDSPWLLLEPLILRFVADIGADFLMNLRMDTQRTPHPLAEAMIRQLKMIDVAYKPERVLVTPFNAVLRFQMWRNARILDAEITKQLHRRFQLLKQQQQQDASNAAAADAAPRASISVIDLAIQDYLSKPGHAHHSTLDPSFVRQACNELRMQFFVGYDSTSALIIYCLHLLAQHPAALAAVRAEHTAVLGADPAAAPAAISANPLLVNALPYTAAVVKETLRLHPIASGLREGADELVLTDPHTGTRFPTGGFSVRILHSAIHRDPAAWVRPDEFLPERFVVGKTHELYPRVKGSWRPFEAGPRMCVGQAMVMCEVKIVLACLVRDFAFADAYAEIDAANGVNLDLAGVGGQRVYLTEAGAGHPIGGYPCRIFYLGS